MIFHPILESMLRVQHHPAVKAFCPFCKKEMQFETLWRCERCSRDCCVSQTRNENAEYEYAVLDCGVMINKTTKLFIETNYLTKKAWVQTASSAIDFVVPNLNLPL